MRIVFEQLVNDRFFDGFRAAFGQSIQRRIFGLHAKTGKRRLLNIAGQGRQDFFCVGVFIDDDLSRDQFKFSNDFFADWGVRWFAGSGFRFDGFCSVGVIFP